MENLSQEDLDKLTPAQKVILYKENGITNDDGSPITEKDIDENNVTLQNEREQNKEPGDRQNEGAAIVSKVGGVESRGKDNAVNNEEQRYVVRRGDRAIRNATLKQVSLSNNDLSSLQLKKVFPNDKFDDYFVEITLAERFREWYSNINNILKNTTNEWTNNYTSERDNVKTWLHTADRQGESGNATEDVWQNRSRTYNDGNRNLQERFEKGEGFGNNRRNDTGDNGQQGSEQNGSGSNPQQSLLEEENHSAETQKFFNGVQSGKFRPQNELKFSKPLTGRNISLVYKV